MKRLVEHSRESMTRALAEILDDAVLDVSLLDGLKDRDLCERMLAALPQDDEPETRLARVILVFCRGFHLGRELAGEALVGAVEAHGPWLSGFVYEGAAAGLAMLDHQEPSPHSRLAAYLEGPGRPHAPLSCIGAGVNPAFRRHSELILAAADPILGWLAVDGYGYREAFIYRRRCLLLQRRPSWLQGYALRAFDQGVGRALWFVFGARLEALIRTIEAFGAERRADLWSGVGFASTYTGTGPVSGWSSLRERSSAPDLAVGSALATWARVRTECATPGDRAACRDLVGRSPEAVARLVEERLAVAEEGDVPAYESWRRGLREQLIAREQHEYAI